LTNSIDRPAQPARWTYTVADGGGLW
jgi:hypothetical protein